MATTNQGYILVGLSHGLSQSTDNRGPDHEFSLSPALSFSATRLRSALGASTFTLPDHPRSQLQISSRPSIRNEESGYIWQADQQGKTRTSARTDR